MPDIRSKGYKGFNSGSAETGTKGWMMWSGSSVAGGQTYSGVGVELVGGSKDDLVKSLSLFHEALAKDIIIIKEEEDDTRSED